MKRTVIATISLDKHRQLYSAGWLHHFAIAKRFDSIHIYEPLIHRAMKEAGDMQFNSVEMTTTECQQNLRENLTQMGFELRQVYYQRILANKDFRIMKSQMGINLSGAKSSKNE